MAPLPRIIRQDKIIKLGTLICPQCKEELHEKHWWPVMDFSDPKQPKEVKADTGETLYFHQAETCGKAKPFLWFELTAEEKKREKEMNRWWAKRTASTKGEASVKTPEKIKFKGATYRLAAKPKKTKTVPKLTAKDFGPAWKLIKTKVDKEHGDSTYVLKLKGFNGFVSIDHYKASDGKIYGTARFLKSLTAKSFDYVFSVGPAPFPDILQKCEDSIASIASHKADAKAKTVGAKVRKAVPKGFKIVKESPSTDPKAKYGYEFEIDRDGSLFDTDRIALFSPSSKEPKWYAQMYPGKSWSGTLEEVLAAAVAEVARRSAPKLSLKWKRTPESGEQSLSFYDKDAKIKILQEKGYFSFGGEQLDARGYVIDLDHPEGNKLYKQFTGKSGRGVAAVVNHDALGAGKDLIVICTASG